MYQIIVVFHIAVALLIIGTVLLQQGRGADAGAGFGGGASNTVFGARGTASFLSRMTAILAALFFTTSIFLAYLGSRPDNKAKDILSAPAAGHVKSDLPSVNNPPTSIPNKSDLPDQPAEPIQGQGKQ